MAQVRIEQALVKAGLVDELQLRSARHHQGQWGGTIARAVVDKGFVTESEVVDAIAHELGVARAELAVIRKDAAALAKVPVGTAEAGNVFPVALRDNGKTLIVAMADPTDLDLTDQLLRTTRCRIKVQVAGDREIADAIRVHYRGEAPMVAGVATAVPVQRETIDIGPMLDAEDLSATRPAKPPPPVPPPRSDARSALDDLLGEGPSGFSADEVARLEALRVNQEKGTRVLQALIDLCVDKGFFTKHEVRTRIKW